MLIPRLLWSLCDYQSANSLNKTYCQSSSVIISIKLLSKTCQNLLIVISLPLGLSKYMFGFFTNFLYLIIGRFNKMGGDLSKFLLTFRSKLCIRGENGWLNLLKKESTLPIQLGTGDCYSP